MLTDFKVSIEQVTFEGCYIAYLISKVIKPMKSACVIETESIIGSLIAIIDFKIHYFTNTAIITNSSNRCFTKSV